MYVHVAQKKVSRIERVVVEKCQVPYFKGYQDGIIEKAGEENSPTFQQAN